ncbi:MAG: hypothetical protein M3440_13135 [Chloroflexota bacterium]|nr:hypothetical protein [Chloroflexota bacterium]
MGFRTCAVVVMLITVLAGGQVAIARQAATPEASCPRNESTPTSLLGTPVATPVGVTADRLSHGGPVVDHVSFVDALRACGLSVEIGGAIEQPFLSAETGTLLRLRGGGLTQAADVQSFEYGDADRAAADASQIGPDGHPPTMMITWLAPPHFFRAEHLIVLYVGDDQAAIDLLTALLGSPFVG